MQEQHQPIEYRTGIGLVVGAGGALPAGTPLARVVELEMNIDPQRHPQ